MYKRYRQYAKRQKFLVDNEKPTNHTDILNNR